MTHALVSDAQTAFAYVALGAKVSLTLSSFAQQAASRVKNSECFLVTDHPELWDSFPGMVIEYNPTAADEVILLLKKNYPEKVLSESGFWMATLERLFALNSLQGHLAPDTEIIHLESDVMCFLTRGQLDQLRARGPRRPAVPLESPNSGCASLLYSPSMKALSEGLEGLAGTLRSNRGWLTDMQLLGRAVKTGIFDELPATPPAALMIDGQTSPRGRSVDYRLVFDATALGMYLFGADPIHTDGVVQPGFIQGDYPLDLSHVSWSLETIPESTFAGLAITNTEGEKFFVANVHVHSKINPGKLTLDSPSWKRFIKAANEQVWDQKLLGLDCVIPRNTSQAPDNSLKNRLIIIFAKMRRVIFFERRFIEKLRRKAE